MRMGKYNEAVITHLKAPDYARVFIAKFGEHAWKDAMTCYQLVVEAIKDNELLIRWIKCVK